MTDDKPEMVTISYKCTEAEAESAAAGSYGPLAEAAREALAARKSLYDRWRERLPTISYRTLGRIDIGGDIEVIPGHGTARVMAAAPQLLDALIKTHSWIHTDHTLYEQATAAIRVALPEDVADEVLGE